MTRNEAINELKCAIDLIKQDGKDWLDERDIPLLQMAIEALERKRGEWIQQRDEYWGVFWFNCSVCGQKPPNDQFGQEWHSNFCPNCGADMRGGNNDGR